MIEKTCLSILLFMSHLSLRFKHTFAFFFAIMIAVISMTLFTQTAHAEVVFSNTSPSNNAFVNGSFSVSYTMNEDGILGSITFTRTGGEADNGEHIYSMTRDDEAAGTHTISRSTLEAGFADPLVNGAVYSITYAASDALENWSSVVNTSVTYDLTAPLNPTELHIFSSNPVYTLAKVGDIVTVVAAVETGTRVFGTIGGKPVMTYTVEERTATLTRLLDGTETQGAGLNFTMFSTDEAGNTSGTVTKSAITDGSSVQTDFTAPSTPTASPAAGTYTSTKSVTLSSSGSTDIRYTTNGNDPGSCSGGFQYAGAISVSSSQTIKVRGCDAAGNMSALATFTYTINTSSGGSGGTPSSPSTPTANPIAGTYPGTVNVTLSSSGSTFIRYTTTGSNPSCTSGTLYNGSISVSSAQTIKAIGCNASNVGSSIGSFIYTILPPVAPTASPAAGTYAGTQIVFLSSVGSASIRYSTNGSNVSCTSGTIYSGSIFVSSSQTIKAVGCSAAGMASVASSFIYTILPPVAPTAVPGSGTYAGAQTVILSSVGANMIRYTEDGSTPTCTTGTVFPGSISVASSKTIKAVGCTTAGIASLASTFFYTINPAASGGATTPAPVSIHDPADYKKILLDFGLQSDPVNFEKNKALIRDDAKQFGVVITEEQVRVIANFVTYGASTETIKLGSGERHAVIRDYFETVSRADVFWEDVQRMTIGQKPVKRNLAKEQAQVPIALTAFTHMTGHAPNFQNASEDLVWNTLMYRIRFPRNLANEQNGIVWFKAIFKRIPVTPFDWAAVRGLGYVLK